MSAGYNLETFVNVLWDKPSSRTELNQNLKRFEPLCNLPNCKTLRKECCTYIWDLVSRNKTVTPEKMINTGFFQGMIPDKKKCQLSKKIETLSVRLLLRVDERNPSREVRQYFADFLWDVEVRDRLLSWVGKDSSSIVKQNNDLPICETIFPKAYWQMEMHSNWHQGLLSGIEAFAEKHRTHSLMIVQGGKIIDQYGDISEPHLVHSCRKSFMSALIGIFVGRGQIDLSKTLKELEIDDYSHLSQKEKCTTLLDMIRSRSGVYHPAAYETQGMKDARPHRSSHPPGEFWYYNNWDFNALGRIFEEITGYGIFEAIDQFIAKPIGMQDFTVTSGIYGKEPESEFPSYDFYMSARDMARFGLLFLNGGKWNDQQIIPEDWVERSTMSYTQGTNSERNPFSGYGFMWWTNDQGYYALGYGGHAIAVIPSKDLVIVHRMANDDDDDPAEITITPHQLHLMLRMIIDAAP